MFETLPVKNISCSMGVFLNGLADKDRANLQKWLDSEWVTNADILRQIQAEANVSFNKDTIASHRKGVCRCSIT